MNHSYYLNRIFTELFDVQIRLLDFENQQYDFMTSNQSYDDLLEAAPKNILDETGTKNDFDGNLFIYWLLMLYV